MIAVHITSGGVQDVQIIAESDSFEALDLALLPIISECLEKLDRRLRRMARAAEILNGRAAKEAGRR